MKFANPEFEKVMFEELDVVLLISNNPVDVTDPDYTEEQFFPKGN